MVGDWVVDGVFALRYGVSNTVGWVGRKALGGDRGADGVFKIKRDRRGQETGRGRWAGGTRVHRAHIDSITVTGVELIVIIAIPALHGSHGFRANWLYARGAKSTAFAHT